MKTVVVIDYGMGNLHSVAKALEHVVTNEKVVVSHDAQTILQADRVVLPGVGAIRDCIGEIKRLGIDQIVREVIQTKPLLGICVGMQALLESSAENNGTQCLSLLHGSVESFATSLGDKVHTEGLKIPHMGWNQVCQQGDHVMWKGIQQNSRFYFVHSYYVKPDNKDIVAATTDYGLNFVSAITQDNVFAVQFHPEKSQHDGLKLYENFLNWDGSSR